MMKEEEELGLNSITVPPFILSRDPPRSYSKTTGG